MKLKALKCKLMGMRTFAAPKIKYEQYTTPPDIAALVVHIAETQYADIHQKSVLDLCCGTGMLGITASFFDPAYIVGVDVDSEALEIAAHNCAQYEISNMDLVHSDVRSLKLGRFDTTLMNPPFGTREAHVDAEAVQVALECSSVVYSLHKSSTRDYLLKRFGGTVLGKIEFDLPSTYHFHRRRVSHVEVDLIRFVSAEYARK